jgi:chromosome partitioning protein
MLLCWRVSFSCKIETMRKIAIVSQKGGAGKTTLAINLAVAAHLKGIPTLLMDLDPQCSATRWKDVRNEALGEDEDPAVRSLQAGRLESELKTADRAGAEFVVIDTSPNSEGTVLAAARTADLVLIPCRPGVLDLHSIAITVNLVSGAAHKTPNVILTMVPHAGRSADEAAEVVKSYGAELAPVRIGYRAVYGHSLAAGRSVEEFEPDSKAALEVQQLYTWACVAVGMSTRKVRHAKTA